jgi:hypothetical protein
MDQKELITADEAASILSMSVNAFRIFVSRYSTRIKKAKLGKRKTYFYRSNILSLLEEA